MGVGRERGRTGGEVDASRPGAVGKGRGEMAIKVGKLYVVRGGRLMEKVVGGTIEPEARWKVLPSGVGAPIKCQVCGEGGGTLVKVSEGKYRHDRCEA